MVRKLLREIDFVAELNGKLLYIQVCYLLETKNVIDREFNALLEINDNFQKYVISLDDFFGESNNKGVQWMNIRDFLTIGLKSNIMEC